MLFRFAAVALLAALASVASAQGAPPKPPPPGPRAGGGEDRSRLKDQLRQIDEKLAGIEKRFSDPNLSDDEEKKLRDQSAELKAQRRDVEAQLRRGPGEGPGGPEAGMRTREMYDKLAALEAQAAKAKEAGNQDEAKRILAEAEMVRAEIRALEERMAAGGPPRPGEPGEPGMGRPFGRPQLTAEDRDKALAWLKENEPTRFERLNDLKSDRPQDYERAVMQIAMDIRELFAMQKNNPERYKRRMEQRKLDYRSSELAEKIRSAGENQDTAAERKELEDVVGKLFDLREADRAEELKNLEAELARLKDTMKKRQDAKDEIVKRRMAELLGEEDDLKWEPGGSGRGYDQPPQPPPTPR